MLFPADATPEQMIELATSAPEAAKYLEGMQIVKTIAIPGRIVNIVVKPQETKDNKMGQKRRTYLGVHA